MVHDSSFLQLSYAHLCWFCPLWMCMHHGRLGSLPHCLWAQTWPRTYQIPTHRRIVSAYTHWSVFTLFFFMNCLSICLCLQCSISLWELPSRGRTFNPFLAKSLQPYWSISLPPSSRSIQMLISIHIYLSFMISESLLLPEKKKMIKICITWGT